MKRRFHFLHLYAGEGDPLGTAILREAKQHKMKVSVTSAEKADGIDLLADNPYLDYLNKAKDGFWDAVHSGFPCTTFSRLRWRQAEGYPGPVRSQRYPYGFPGQPLDRQKEADEGTLHASRSVHLTQAVLDSRPQSKIRPVGTLENPPPSDHPEHLSGWELPEVAKLAAKQGFTKVEFTTCAYQTDLPLGRRTYKPQMFGGNLPGMSSLSARCPCEGGSHIPVIGKRRSSASGRYPDMLCDKYAQLLILQFKRMAHEEFMQRRQEDLQAEVHELRQRTRQRAQQERTPLPRKKTRSSKAAEAKASTSKSKAKPDKPAAKKEDDDEYTYEYYTAEEDEDEEMEVKPEAESKDDDAEDFKPLEWKGGPGRFGLLRDPKSKSSDPANLNYVGGMRNPANTVNGMPNAQALGLRIFAAWERLTRSNPIPMETAANYGSSECDLDPKVVEVWRAELRKLVGSRGKLRADLQSRWTYKSPLQSDIIRGWTARAADADVDIATWADEGTPLGINMDITPRGIFPPADKETEQESLMDAAMQMARGAIANYSSVADNIEDTKEEVARLQDKGYLLRITDHTVKEEFSQETISKLAIIVKERPDKTRKRRLIIDLRRSGGNSKAKLREKLVLPRAVDAVGSLRSMVHLKGDVLAIERNQMWAREFVLIDVTDAFPHLAVHRLELEHCITPGLEEIEYFLSVSRTAVWI
eukprot:s972_g12.t1